VTVIATKAKSISLGTAMGQVRLSVDTEFELSLQPWALRTDEFLGSRGRVVSRERFQELDAWKLECKGDNKGREPD
jgi:hypothetical protein